MSGLQTDIVQTQIATGSLRDSDFVAEPTVLDRTGTADSLCRFDNIFLSIGYGTEGLLLVVNDLSRIQGVEDINGICA